MTDAVHYRVDDLRRFAATLGARVGIPPARAAALASHLLWYDCAGVPSYGIATLPDWLERVASDGVDAETEGTVTSESLGTAVLDGGNGLAPLILARAAALALEKARDAAVGVVRVGGLVAAGPAAGVAAEMAIGPVAAAVLGPGPVWSLALPSADGLPAVYDSELTFEHAVPATASSAAPAGKKAGRASKTPPVPPAAPAPVPLALWAPWATALIPEGGWLVAALSIKAVEPLSTLHERVDRLIRETADAPGRLLPPTWERRRLAAREHGIAVTKPCWARLGEWADRLSTPLPPAASVAPSVRSASGAM